MSERWRVGTKVAVNVYEGDRPVCQCHTPRDARLIVSAVNAMLDRNASVYCRWCIEGSPRIHSSVSDAWIHHTSIGRIVCVAGPSANTSTLSEAKHPQEGAKT